MVILIILCFVTKIIENSHGKKKFREIGKGNKIVLPKGRKQDLCENYSTETTERTTDYGRMI